jgi:hypothetical protein
LSYNPEKELHTLKRKNCENSQNPYKPCEHSKNFRKKNPETLNPTPNTLKTPKPYTQYPKNPETLNPIPNTLKTLKP